MHFGRRFTTVILHILSIPSVLICFCTLAGAAWAQTYPTKPVRIVTFEPDGVRDVAAQLIAPGLARRLGQQVLVDNRPAGVVPGQIVSKAAPDGHTLLFTTGVLWILPLMQSAPFDPVQDFAPVTLVANTPNILVTHPSVPVKTVGELIELAKDRPGELNYASGAADSSSHLAAELFKSMAGVKIVRVPYRGAGPAVLAVVGGQVQLMFGTANSVQRHIASGRLRPLAVTSARRSTVAPELPTMAETGLKGYETVTAYALFAPAGISAAIVGRLNSEIVQVLKQNEVKERFLAAGVEVVGSLPTELTAVMKADVARMSKVIKSTGMRAE